MLGCAAVSACTSMDVRCLCVVCLCGCVCMCVHVGMWKPEVVAGSLPPSLSILFLCVHRMHICCCTCGCTGTQWSEVDAGCLSSPLSTLWFEDLSLNLDLIISAQLSGPWLQGAACLCLFSSSGVPGAHMALSFYVVVGDPNSGRSLHTGCSLQRSGLVLAVSASPREGCPCRRLFTCGHRGGSVLFTLWKKSPPLSFA